MRIDALFAHAARLGVDVHWADLGEVRRGEYRDNSRLIILDRSLTEAQATATLAHEVGHAAYRDRCLNDPAAERRAWEYGATLVIREDEYRTAERLVGSHPSAIAAELGVTRRLVECWRHWYARTQTGRQKEVS